ncbi:MAG TPA: galactose-1-phosphate uridylyltransferase [Bryobacteraceae bacterium]|nr:galactose-1-phosphate uridylyltransferase [Bryobacteraceae bacterium]
MSELRWHPLLREWVGVAAKRQNRPQMPQDWCPFCPGSGQVPDRYDTLLYPNDFAALSKEYPPFEDNPGLFHSTGARGVCDVVIYHPNHNLTPAQMPAEHWRKVVDLWCSRTEQLFADPEIAYVYIFENTGVAMGVTMPHPHGQIYALPFIPPLVEREFVSASEYFATENECLYCRLLQGELSAGARIALETPGFVAFVPFHAKWPGEMQICPRRHFGALTDLTDAERTELARIIKAVRMKYDNLWGFPIPLMMMLRQRAVRGEHQWFHFHVEFCPIQRSPTKLKYLAGVESGTGTFLNDTLAEEKAAEFRATEPLEF